MRSAWAAGHHHFQRLCLRRVRHRRGVGNHPQRPGGQGLRRRLRCLGPVVFAGFDALQSLSPTVCRPFDANRDGLARGEGAAVLTLETLESRRGAARKSSAKSPVTPRPLTATISRSRTRKGRRRCAAMGSGVPDRPRRAGEIDYVNAHGTGTPLNDGPRPPPSAWAGTPRRDLAGEFHQGRHRSSARGRRRGRNGGLPDGLRDNGCRRNSPLILLIRLAIYLSSTGHRRRG